MLLLHERTSWEGMVIVMAGIPLLVLILVLFYMSWPENEERKDNAGF